MFTDSSAGTPRSFASRLRAMLRAAGAARVASSAPADTQPAMLEGLESRQLLSVSILNPLPDVTLSPSTPNQTINLGPRYDNANFTGSIVRWDVNFGNNNRTFYVELFDQTGPDRTRTTPLTVANFLQYTNPSNGTWTYSNTIFHRRANLQGGIPFVLQGGGFRRPTAPSNVAGPEGEPTGPITTLPTVLNEPGNSNVRGTIAMAKLGGDPNSASNQFFFNLGNNAANLNNQNGGFTVFGRVVGNGMTIVDEMAGVPVYNASNFYGNNALGELPLTGLPATLPPTVNIQPESFVSVTNITQVNELRYIVTSSDASVVQATVNAQGQLQLTYGANRTADAVVSVRVISDADGTEVTDEFTVSPASMESVTASTATLQYAGAPLTLTGNNPATTIGGGSIARVTFFRDTNNNGLLDNGDANLGEDTSADGGWTLNAVTNSFTVGNNRLFAQATDSAGNLSNPVAVTVNVVRSTPVEVGTFTANPSPLGAPGQPVTLTAGGVTTLTPGGTITEVRFFRDTNSNGQFDQGTDALLATTTTGTGGTFTANLNSAVTGNFTRGVNRLFAVATDSAGRTSVARTFELTVRAMTATPNPVTRNSNFTVEVENISTAGGGFQSVRFFYDTNDNGLADPGIDEQLPGTVRLINGRWTLTISSSFARFADGNNTVVGLGNRTVSLTEQLGSVIVQIINNPPTVSNFTLSTAVLTSNSQQITFSVTASDRDPLSGNGIGGVAFFADTNNNGVWNEGVDKLLGDAARVGTSSTYRLTSTNAAFADGSLTPGTYTIFAIARDQENADSTPAVATLRINAAPVVAAASAPTVFRRSTLTITATGVTDDAGIARVEFWRDTNGNGTFEAGTDKLLGSDTSSAGGWTFNANTSSFSAGVNTFFVRAVDSNNALSSVVTTTATVNNLTPSVTAVTFSPTTAPSAFSTITLTARAVDADGTIASIRFYFDSNRDGVLTTSGPNADQFLGEDATPANGFTWAQSLDGITGGSGLFVGTVGIPAAANRFFAVAIDNDGPAALGASNALLSAQLRVLTAPAVGTVTVNPTSLARLQNFSVSATDITGPANITRVEFWRDVNNDGQITSADRLLGNGVRSGTGPTAVWTLNNVSTAGFATGNNAILARAFDSAGASSAGDQLGSATLAVTNLAPTLTSLTVSPTQANTGVDGSVTLTASPADADGTVARVRFYFDTNANGVFDSGSDQLLGEDTSASGGWKAVINLSAITSGLGVGLGSTAPNRFLAVAVDNDNAQSVPRLTAVPLRVNNAPAVDAVTTSVASIARLQRFNATASGITTSADAGETVARVEFWRDVNNDGLITSSDQLLGNGVRSGTGPSATWTLNNIPTAGFATGDNDIIARAVDNLGGLGFGDQLAVATITVTNIAPAVSALTVSSTLATLGTNGSVTLTATPSDSDGTISRVRFYFDTNRNGVFDNATDQLLGEDTSSADGWKLTVLGSQISTAADSGLAIGLDSTIVNRFFAVATDNDTTASTARASTTAVPVNALPTSTSFTTLGPSTFSRSGNNFLRLAGALDPDNRGISRVEIWFDRNGTAVGDGQFQTTDRLIGNAFRQSGSNPGATNWELGFVGSILPTSFVGQNITFFARIVDLQGGITLRSLSVPVVA